MIRIPTHLHIISRMISMKTNTKFLTYTLLAITFGYVIISSIPSLIPEGQPMIIQTEEEPKFLKNDVETALGESMERSEDHDSSLNEVFSYSYWILDLIIAIIVYFVAKKLIS